MESSLKLRNQSCTFKASFVLLFHGFVLLFSFRELSWKTICLQRKQQKLNIHGTQVEKSLYIIVNL